MEEPRMAKSDGILVVVMPFQANGKVGHGQTGTGQSAQKPEGARMKELLKSLDSLKKE